MFLPTQSTTRWAQGCRPRSKQQVGFEKEDQDLVSALAASKNASCCRCAKRRAGIRDRDRPLPSSRPLARSLCGHTTRSRLADGEAGRTPCVGFYGDRICGTSRSDQVAMGNRIAPHRTTRRRSPKSRRRWRSREWLPLVSKVNPFHLADFAAHRACSAVEAAPAARLKAISSARNRVSNRRA